MTHKLTLDEINERLRSVGVEPNKAWTQNQSGVTPGFLNQIRELGPMLKDALELQIASDQKHLSELREALMRIRHGGGS